MKYDDLFLKLLLDVYIRFASLRYQIIFDWCFFKDDNFNCGANYWVQTTGSTLLTHCYIAQFQHSINLAFLVIYCYSICMPTLSFRSACNLRSPFPGSACDLALPAILA